jgi:hypothetical protein
MWFPSVGDYSASGSAAGIAAISSGVGIIVEANGRISSTTLPGAISESFSPFMLMGA